MGVDSAEMIADLQELELGYLAWKGECALQRSLDGANDCSGRVGICTNLLATDVAAGVLRTSLTKHELDKRDE